VLLRILSIRWGMGCRVVHTLWMAGFIVASWSEHSLLEALRGVYWDSVGLCTSIPAK